MATTKRNKEVGTVASHPVFHFIRIKIGAAGAVSSTFQGGGLSISSVALGTTGLYTLTFAPPAPFYPIVMDPKYHKPLATSPRINVSYVPGSWTVSAAGVVTMQIQCTGDTAANNTAQVAANPTSGSEIHMTLVECYNTAVRPRP